MLGQWRRHGSRRGAADLAAGIRMLVLDGRLPAGTGLPPEREVAGALGVSRTMVGTAWQSLRTAGLVVSRQGAGSWTASPSDPPPPGGPPPSAVPQLIDLARAVPSAVAGVDDAAARALPLLTAELGSHGYAEYGLPRLRELLAERYTRRGLPTTPDQILVTNGGHQVLALALRLFTGPGDRVLIEQPSYPNAIEAIRAAHGVPVPVAMTEDGWDLDGVTTTLRQAAPRLAYLITDFQNPTGFRMAEPDRKRLGAALRRARTPVVVDETNVDLALDRTAPLTPLAAYAGDLALLAGSASKSHWGGLRLGWVRASTEVIDRLVVARRGIDLGSPVFEQLVLADLLERPPAGQADRLTMLAAQRDALVAAVRADCPQWTFRVPAGGLSLWCRLPEPMSTRIAAVAQNFGVRVVPGGFFAAHGGLEPWLRLPYTLPAESLVEAVHRLAQAAASVTGCGLPVADSALFAVT
jgi:DNA-binding transcriptional MocR family regulator